MKKNPYIKFMSSLSILILTFFLLLPFYQNAQQVKRATYWNFATNVSVKIDCVPTSLPGSALVSSEGSTTMSDLNGDLLFYSNGVNVWDKNNTLMPNGTGLHGDPSSQQSAIAVPDPANANGYYLFTTDAIWEHNAIWGVNWNYVDMTANGGNGDVTSKNNQLSSEVQERIVAVRNASSTGYWIVVLKTFPGSLSSANQGYNVFHAYEVTASGVNTTPVVSTTGPMLTWQSYGMFMSPQGNALVTVNAGTQSGLEVYDFNNSTGVLNHRWEANITPFIGSGFAISQDGNVLYGCRSTVIVQLDLTAPTLAAFEASALQISPPGTKYRQLQLAPDCKMYAIPTTGNSLSVIDKPNVLGAGCGYSANAISLVAGSFGNTGTFPNFCASFFEEVCDNNLEFSLSGTDAGCMNDGSASVVNLQGQPPYSVLWSNGETTQTISNLSGGMYTVTVTDARCSLTDSIFINQPATVSIDSEVITNASACGATDGAINIQTSAIGGGVLSLIHEEGFETDGQTIRYIANPYPGNTNNNSFFKRGDNSTINFNTSPTGPQGTSYFGARRTGFQTIPQECSVTINPINVAGYSNLQACALLAIANTNMNTSAINHITIEYNMDGLGWNDLAVFKKPNGFPSYGLSEDTNNDGVGDGIVLTTTFKDFCYTIPTNGINLEVRVSTDMSGSSQIQGAFDHIRVKGIAPYTYTYLWSNGETTEDISNLGEGIYDVTITTSTGCIIQDTFTVIDPCVVVPLIPDFTASNTTICEGECINFTDQSTGTNINAWNWAFDGATSLSSTTQNPTVICWQTAGIYDVTLIVTDATGTETITKQITVTAKPIVSANALNLTICQGENIELTANGANTLTYSWTGPNGYTSSQQNPTLLNAASTMTGKYIVTASTGANCTAKDSVTIIVNPKPTVSAGQNKTICLGDSVILNGSGANSYTWNNGITNNVYFEPNVTGTTTYTVTGVDANSCSNTSTVTVVVTASPTPSFTADILASCKPHPVEFTNTSVIAGATCNWDFGDGTILNDCSNVINHTYTDDGNYDVTLIINLNGCIGSITKPNYIQVSGGPTAEFTADPMITNTDQTVVNFTNESENATNYSWSFGDNSPENTVINPTHTFPQDIENTYTVILTAEDAQGCKDYKIVTIVVQAIKLEYEIPNVFTPNNDGRNDFFELISAKGILELKVVIFNRWGNIVFETNDKNFVWNGQVNNVGIDCSEGVYFYKMEFTGINMEKMNEQGFIHLNREK